MIIFSFLVVVAVAAFCVFTTFQHGNSLLKKLASDHTAERLRWNEERAKWDEERRYLIDRVIARHSHDIIAMDKASQPRDEMAETMNRYDLEQRLSAHVPEGL